MELSEGQGFVFPLKSRRQQGTIGTDSLIFPKTQLTNMMRIVIVAIDGVFMAGFSEVQVIGCKDTIHVSTDDNQDMIQVCRAVVGLGTRLFKLDIWMYSLLIYNHVTYL